MNFYEEPIFASDCSTIEPRSNELDVRYVYRFLQSLQPWINAKLRQGAAQPHVYSKDIANIIINFPSLSEQRRIVTILDGAFEVIATATANAEKNLANARALFDRELGRIFADNTQNWPLKRLPEIALDFGRGKSKHRPRNDPSLYGGPYPFVQTGDISDADHWLTDYTQTYSAVGLAQSKRWPKGTVCIAIVGATVGETAILGFEACFPDSVIGIVVDPAIMNAEYVEYLLQAFKTLLKEKGKGTARDNINLGTFENQLFPVPSLETQNSVCERLNELAGRIRELEDIYQFKMAALAELRKSVLDRAFGGSWLSHLAIDLEAAAE